MPRAPSLTAQALQELGAIGARQEAQAARLDGIERSIAEVRHTTDDDRKRLFAKLDGLEARLDGRDATLEKRVEGLELFRNRVGAVVALAGSAVTLLAGGLWYLLTTFWADVIAAFRKLWP